MIQRSEQQTAATTAGETERPEALRIDAILGGKHREGHQVVREHCSGEGLAQRTGRTACSIKSDFTRPASRLTSASTLVTTPT